MSRRPYYSDLSDFSYEDAAREAAEERAMQQAIDDEERFPDRSNEWDPALRAPRQEVAK